MRSSVGVGGHEGRFSRDSLLFQSFLEEPLVSKSGIGRDVHSLMLSIQHFLCRPRRHPPSKVPWRMVLERLSWRVTLPVVRRDSADPQGSGSCSAPSRWSCAANKRREEFSSEFAKCHWLTLANTLLNQMLSGTTTWHAHNLQVHNRIDLLLHYHIILGRKNQLQCKSQWYKGITCHLRLMIQNWESF